MVCCCIILFNIWPIHGWMSDNHRPTNVDVTGPLSKWVDRSRVRAIASMNGADGRLRMIREGCADIACGNQRHGRGYDLEEGIHGSEGRGIRILPCGLEAPVGAVIVKQDVGGRQNDDQSYDGHCRHLHLVHGPSPAGRPFIGRPGRIPSQLREPHSARLGGTWHARIKGNSLSMND